MSDIPRSLAAKPLERSSKWLSVLLWWLKDGKRHFKPGSVRFRLQTFWSSHTPRDFLLLVQGTNDQMLGMSLFCGLILSQHPTNLCSERKGNTTNFTNTNNRSSTYSAVSYRLTKIKPQKWRIETLCFGSNSLRGLCVQKQLNGMQQNGIECSG